MSAHTERELRLTALYARKQANAGRVFDNVSLPAGSPMYLPCRVCNELIEHDELYLIRTELCADCQELKDRGWI